jgi:hypothetical protein
MSGNANVPRELQRVLTPAVTAGFFLFRNNFHQCSLL